MLLLRQIYGFKLPTVRENQTKYVSIIIQLFFCNPVPHAYPRFRSMDIILPIILFVTKVLWKYAYWIEMWDAKNTSQATTFITLPLTTSLLIWNEKACGYNMFLSTRFFPSARRMAQFSYCADKIEITYEVKRLLLLWSFPLSLLQHTHAHTLYKERQRPREHGRIVTV